MSAASSETDALKKRPFSLTADLDFLYPSQQHERVYGETLSAIRRRDGLICVIGEPGAGKTMLCRRLLEELNGDFNVALVSTPPQTPRDLAETLDAVFGDMQGDARIPLAVFDEAQHLDFRCLDHVKFLTNLERDAEKLVQIVLVGQPELADKLGHKRFNQLEQRIGAKLAVGPLKSKEVLPYLTHRLTVAGLSGEVRFTRLSALYLHRKSAGVPRLINRVANIAVEQARERGRGRIGVRQVRRAFLSVSATRDNWLAPPKPAARGARVFALVLLLGLAAAFVLYDNPQWRAFLMTGSRGESSPSASHFVVKAGTFLARDQAEQLREELGKQGFPAAVAEKGFGDGWVLYQVRLEGRYTRDEADNVTEILRTVGVKSVDAIEIKP